MTTNLVRSFELKGVVVVHLVSFLLGFGKDDRLFEEERSSPMFLLPFCKKQVSLTQNLALFLDAALKKERKNELVNRT